MLDGFVTLGEEEQLLLKAIVAAHDDDLPRLVYADWLDERGRSAAAEFIRTQIEAARLPLGDSRRRTLDARAFDLQSSPSADGEWLFTPDERIRWYIKEFTYERGLLERITCSIPAICETPAGFLENIPTVRSLILLPEGGVGRGGWSHDFRALAAKREELQQLDELVIDGGSVSESRLVVPPSALSPLIVDPLNTGLRNLRRLAFQYVPTPRSDDGNGFARVVGMSPHLGRLEELEFLQPGTDETGVRELVREAAFTHLRSLTLRCASGVNGDAVIAAIVESPALQRLECLDLINLIDCPVTQQGYLNAARNLPRLCELSGYQDACGWFTRGAISRTLARNRRSQGVSPPPPPVG